MAVNDHVPNAREAIIAGNQAIDRGEQMGREQDWGLPPQEEDSGMAARDVSAKVESIATGQPAYAGFWVRLIASFLDGIVLIVLTLILVIPIVAVLTSVIRPHSLDRGSADLVVALAVLPLIGVYWLYYAGFDSSRYMATPGKMLCGLKVVNADMGRISFLQATARFFIKMIPGLIRIFPGTACSCISLLFSLGDVFAMYTNDQRQCFHDMMAGTYVVSGYDPGPAR